MFQNWLAPDELEGFWANHFNRAPFARADGAIAAISLFTWDTVDRVLRSCGPLDVLTVSGGRLVDDWLYIPATWWHLVKCAEDALSISVGIMSPAALTRSAQGRVSDSYWSQWRSAKIAFSSSASAAAAPLAVLSKMHHTSERRIAERRRAASDRSRSAP